MEIILVDENEPYWDKLIAFSSKCSWLPGKKLATRMENGDFKDDEQIFAAIENDEIAGFCVFEENGYIPPEYNYHPFINLVFVDESYRGKRVSEKLIEKALSYGKELGLNKVYLKSEHRGLYEKYGFKKIADFKPIVGLADQIFEKAL
ncbi:GNAT family N-acetyltransferase [Pseudobutyrivibrio ruminis]|uniref:Acetyltransferase (GNAT) domain-containing protein n=2 Tax=Pseudobutyrivibrio ruminis DSM 9787 TaxID=1123011 RepID=A0A285T4S2_9FIRM|nr:GNAT family N-acetyltransferase [Pseudobutyrivibrio ruminis]SOC16218.1 Acetyltransferase (GNAT) domain-containing protein [Pseudobutyrivibrio ruminis DSM 9787]